MKRLMLLLSAAVTLSLASNALAQDWPQWRGENMNGVAATGDDYPRELSEKTMLFKTPIPGIGSSTPIVKGAIFLTAGVKDDGEEIARDTVFCYSETTGEEKWRVPLGEERAGKHKNGSGSCPSLCANDSHVFAYFKSGTLAALNQTDGEVAWKVNLQEKYGEDSLWWDLGTSPVCADGKVIVAVMHEEDSYLVAFNQSDGQEAWKVDRNYEVRKESGQSYTTPIVMGNKAGDEANPTLLVWGADHLTAHSAKDGSTIWECGGFNPENQAMWRVIASPAVTNGVACVPYGRAKHVAGIKIGGEGDVTETNRLWEHSGFGSDVPAPVAHDGTFYLLGDKGDFRAIDALSGKTLWKENLPKARGKFYASPVYVSKPELKNSLMYLLRDSGKTYVAQANAEEFKLVHEGDLKERLAASPVMVNGLVLVRGAEHLYAFRASQ